jgi:hypothetical protein
MPLTWTVSKTALRESPFIMREEMPPRLLMDHRHDP